MNILTDALQMIASTPVAKETIQPKRDQKTCKHCLQSFKHVSTKNLHQVLCARNLTNRYQDARPRFTIDEKVSVNPVYRFLFSDLPS